MMTDPLNQPPVYEYDQVITRDDLVKMMGNLSNDALYAGFNNDDEANRFDIAMRTLEVLLMWIDTGKSPDITLG